MIYEMGIAHSGAQRLLLVAPASRLQLGDLPK